MTTKSKREIRREELEEAEAKAAAEEVAAEVREAALAKQEKERKREFQRQQVLAAEERGKTIGYHKGVIAGRLDMVNAVGRLTRSLRLLTFALFLSIAAVAALVILS